LFWERVTVHAAFYPLAPDVFLLSLGFPASVDVLRSL